MARDVEVLGVAPDEARLAELAARVGDLTRTIEELAWKYRDAARFRAPFYYLGGRRGLTYLETGQPFYVNTEDCGLTPWLIMGGHWETWADRIVSSYVRPGMKIIDVGANVGYYAVKWGTMIGPKGELHAFEANPELSSFIHENFVLNGLSGHCRLHPHAAGADVGEAVLTFTDHNTGLGTLRNVEMPPGVVKSHRVAVAPLDRVLEGMPNVDLIKIDVEGFEPSVLAGAQRLISRSPRCAFHLEVQKGWEADGRGIAETLAPVAQDRALFVLGHDCSLTHIDLERVHEYVFGLPSGLADLFVCPPGDEYIGRVRQFVRA